MNPSQHLFFTLLYASILLCIFSCGRDSDNSVASGGLNTGSGSGSGVNNAFSGNWLLPQDEIRDGGPGIDGIPSVDNPRFAPVEEIDYIPDDRMVIGIHIDGEVRAYPHQILDWHEIINDRINDESFAIVYCPLTGTGMCWSREVNGSVTEFGVSGLLFRNNLIAYDRNTISAWSQMQLRSVNGDLSARNIETYPIIETTWKTWKMLYPWSEIQTTNTGHNRNYSTFTYGEDYATNHNRILFPIMNQDSRLQNKERVLGIIGTDTADENAIVKAYPISQFGSGINLIKDQVGDNEYLIIGSSNYNLAIAFLLNDDTGSLEFEAIQDQLPVVIEDDEGNKWDVFGNATEGVRTGERLEHARSYVGYWFAFADFFPGLEIR